MVLQIYNLLHAMSNNDRDCDFYHRLVQFIDSYDPPLKGLQEDLNFVSPRIGEVLEAVGPVIFLSTDTRKLRNEGFLSPYHPRYPDILTNSAHPMRAQDLANVTSYREWVLFGYLVCPDELLRVTSIDIAMVNPRHCSVPFCSCYAIKFAFEFSLYQEKEKVVLKENLVLTIFRDEYILLHEDYQLYVLPRILESKKMAKSGRTKQKEADLEYSVAKQVEKMISEVHEQAFVSCDAIHRERRILLKQEIGRMVLFFTDQPSLLAPNIQVTKIGRDAVLYVESLIESIMGGLEGLINILDSEGGFGALENQLLPEQAASYINFASRVSNPSTKSPKLSAGYALPGHESYPENDSSIKMLEAAMQRLTNLCSVLNDMEPICVLNHVFVLREYMRECILGNFRRRLLAVLKTDNDLQRPSILESLIRRHISIVHLAEQHISMDLTQGIREVLLTEAFSGPVSSLHLFEKVTEQPTGSAAEAVCNWYIENIIKDVSGAGILFAPIHKCFKSTRPVGGYFADSVADLRELQAFVRIFGGYGVDRLDHLLKEHTAALLNCIDTSLRSNREVLEAVAGSLHSGDRIEREASMKQVVDLDTVIEFCVQAGLALAFDGLLAEAAGAVLEEGAPLIYSLLAEVVKHVPDEIPEKKEIRRLKGVANSVGVVCDHDSQWMVFSALAFAQSEVIWYFQHVGIASSKSKAARMVPVDIDQSDPTIGFLLDGIDRLCCLVRKYIAAIRGYALSYLSSCAGRIRFLLGTPGMVALDLDAGLKGLLQQIVQHLENIPNLRVKIFLPSHDFRKDWLTILMIVTSSRSNINIRHLEKATVSTGKEGLLSEGNAAYNWSRCVDELESQLSKHGSLKSSISTTSTLQQNTMFGPEGRPQHCCAWLGVATTTFMASNVWNTTAFNVETGGFNNNINCLARCISAVIAGSEFVRLEREHQQRQSFSNGHVDETLDSEIQSRLSAEASIKSTMQLFVKFSAGIILDSWSETNRSHLVAQVIFLDQLCEISPYLPRSSLELHIPYAILRSIYSQYYANNPSTLLALLSVSPRHSPAVSQSHASPVIRQGRGDSTPQYLTNDSGYFKSASSSYSQEHIYDNDSGNFRGNENKHRNVRRSGPLDYSSSRKVKHVEGSTSGSTGPSPLPRFAVSRSGPIAYK
ncbi:protein nap1 [Quercus suber]|uniref:Protein nap1 n=1 Tax=Quercus suber TaxID=58331 RepID=A0AAW0KGJ6_QUESU